MSEYIDKLEQYCKSVERPDLQSIFYNIFTNTDTTVDQIKEIAEHAIFDPWEASFNANPMAMYNSIRIAFLKANKKLDLINKFDNEYKEYFINRICPMLQYDYVSDYPKEILIKCGHEVEWFFQDSKFFCDEDLQPLIKKYAQKFVPDIFTQENDFIYHFKDNPGKLFWLLVSCGVEFDQKFIEDIFETKNMLFDDYDYFVEPIRHYISSGEKYFTCGNEKNEKSFYDLLDKLPNTTKALIRLRD